MNGIHVEEAQVESYVGEVARALGHLDEEERTAVLDDVREHAAAVLAAEPGIDLTTRLGPPRDFALELLDSAGLTATTPDTPRTTWRMRYQRFSQSRVGRLVDRARQDFGPAWAALRGVAVVVIVGWLLSGGRPQYLPLLTVIGAIGGWLLSGQYRELIARGTVGRTGGWVMNVATVVGMLLLASHAGASYDPGVDEELAAPMPSAMSDQGTQAFGPDGSLLPVALFDGYGNPITMAPWDTGDLRCAENLSVVAVPYLSSTGQSMDNVFPIRGVCVDDDNTVVTDAHHEAGTAEVQTWTLAGMPTPGQRIILDDEGLFHGVIAADPASPASSAPAPTNGPSDSPPPPQD